MFTTSINFVQTCKKLAVTLNPIEILSYPKHCPKNAEPGKQVQNRESADIPEKKRQLEIKDSKNRKEEDEQKKNLRLGQKLKWFQQTRIGFWIELLL